MLCSIRPGRWWPWCRLHRRRCRSLIPTMPGRSSSWSTLKSGWRKSRSSLKRWRSTPRLSGSTTTMLSWPRWWRCSMSTTTRPELRWYSRPANRTTPRRRHRPPMMDRRHQLRPRRGRPNRRDPGHWPPHRQSRRPSDGPRRPRRRRRWRKPTTPTSPARFSGSSAARHRVRHTALVHRHASEPAAHRRLSPRRWRVLSLHETPPLVVIALGSDLASHL